MATRKTTRVKSRNKPTAPTAPTAPKAPKVPAIVKPVSNLLTALPDPARPPAPTSESLALGAAWVRRNFEGYYTNSMPEDIRPNGPGRIVSATEGAKYRGVFWETVFAPSAAIA